LKKFHMNEGHSALLTLELFHMLHKNIEDVRERCVFTTHTPVPAGHDQFDRGLAENMLGDFLTRDFDDHIYLDNKLNMTYLGLRFSKFINGVAKKHGEVSRTMFPGYHIESITNGVHSGFWTSKYFKDLYTRYIPGWETDPFNLRYILGIKKEEIWDAHVKAKSDLIRFVNARYNSNMDVQSFTIGFARRAATYKRGELLFRDMNRLRHIALKFPIQIIYAGKAHPNDNPGKEVIQRIIGNMKGLQDKIKVCYVEDYDMVKGLLLTSGVDIWMNTPMPPLEASGTSGMKAAHNGIPQFSILDGWWIEGHIENTTGWSIGSLTLPGKEHDEREDIEDMYDKLEYVIVPRYYNERDKWVETMQHSIAINGSFFNTHRMVMQYVLNAYFI
jgi:glycogen phosphorylase